MVTKTRLLGCGTLMLLILAACGELEAPVAPEGDEEADVTPVEGDAALVAPVRFGTPQRWSTSFCRKDEVCLIADVDGNRRADAIAFRHGVDGVNHVYVARSNGTGFGPAEKWSDSFCRTGEICKVTDVNKDARPDLVSFRHGVNGSNAVYVALSNGSSFGPAQQWSPHFCTATETCEVGDVQWSSRSALIAFTRDPNNEVWVGLSTGTSFRTPVRWSLFFCRTGEVCMSGDFNSDNYYDVIAFNHGVGGANAVYVATANKPDGNPPSSFSPTAKASDYFCTKSQTCAVGDVTGDDRDDVIAFTRGTTPSVWVGISVP